MTTSIENDLEELLSCAICLGTLSEPKLLPCSHRFCKPCIIMEMDRSASSKGSQRCFPCPLCKRDIKLGKGKSGEDWIIKFETDRLLKDIQDLLKQERDDSKEMCLSHRKKLSLVCYSCGTTGCYICAWQEHRGCADVQNFQTEARRIKLDLQKHLEEIEKCIDKIVPYVARWSSTRKSLKNQRDYSNRFIEECLKHLHREFVSAVEDLVQDYECYISGTSMPTYVEEEIRRLMELFPNKINGEINIFDIQSRLQSRNETILFPQIREASKRLESVQDVQLLISTVENIKQVLDLSKENFVLKGKDLLTQKANVLSNRFRDNIVQSMEATLPRVVQDSLVIRPDQINLGKQEGERLMKDLKVALQNVRNPKELMETCGRLCYPDGYHQQFKMYPAVPAKVRKRRNTEKRVYIDAGYPVLAFVLIQKRNFNLFKHLHFNREEFQVKLLMYPRDDSRRKKRRYALTGSQRIEKEQFTFQLYKKESADERKDILPQLEFCSFNSLRDKGNGEPFPTSIQRITVPLGHPIMSTMHIFQNTDDEEEGLECERITFDDIGNGLILTTIWTMTYERKGLFTTCSKAITREVRRQKEILLAVFISIICFVFTVVIHELIH